MSALFDLPDPGPQVYNRRKNDAPDGSVYIGRGSVWGNPFVIGEHGDRDEVIRKYEEYFMAQPDLIERARSELKGKSLVCYCKPAACHGDFLLRIANN